MTARGVEFYGRSASKSPSTYRRCPGAHHHAWTTRSSVKLPASQGLSTLGGGYCHDLFPELSLTYLHSSRSSLASHWVHYGSPSLSATHPTSPSRLHPTSIQCPIP